MAYKVLQIFPFTSETKRMGIIVQVSPHHETFSFLWLKPLIPLQDDQTGELLFYTKGADTVMTSIVQFNDWLDEEVDNMAREGLRTLVVAKKTLSQEQYNDFEVSRKLANIPRVVKMCHVVFKLQQRYNAAKLSITNRNAQVAAVRESLERDMELLCVTGVEDKLQVQIVVL